MVMTRHSVLESFPLGVQRSNYTVVVVFVVVDVITAVATLVAVAVIVAVGVVLLVVAVFVVDDDADVISRLFKQ